MFLLTYLDRAMFGPLLPYIEREFIIDHAASTRLLLYMSIGYSASMFLSGFVAPHVRPRIMVGVSVTACGMLMLGIAVVPGGLLPVALLLCLMGIAAGQYFNGGLSTMRSLVAPADWSKAISIHEIGPNGSFILGPILAEVAAGYVGWRGSVAIMGGLTLAAGVFFLFAARGGHEVSAPVSFKGMGQALQSPQLWLCAWLMGIAIAGEFAPYSVLTLHLVDDRRLSSEMAAFLLSASRVASPFAVLCGGFVTVRFGTRRTLVFCLCAYALGMFLMAMPWLSALFAGMFTQPMLTAMIFPPIFTLLAEGFPIKDQPIILAIVMPLASFFGVGLMPSVLGMWGDYVSFNAGFVMMGCMVALSLPLMRAIAPGKR